METRISKLALGVGLTLSTSIALAGPIYEYDFQANYPDEAGVWSDLTRTTLGGPYTRFLGRYGNQTVSLRLNATEKNTAGLGGNGDSGDQGDGGDNNPFNLTQRPVASDRRLVPYPDQGGGGNNPPANNGTFDHDGPSIDLGGAVNGGGSNGDEPTNGDPRFTTGTYALTFDLMLFDSWDGNNAGFGPDGFRVDINGETVFDELFEIHDLSNNFRMPDELPELNAYRERWQDQIYRDITLLFDIGEATDHFDFDFIGTLDQVIHDESWAIDNVRIDAIDPVAPLASPSVPAPSALTLLGTGLGLMTRRRR
jgi:hypothetical protein